MNPQFSTIAPSSLFWPASKLEIRAPAAKPHTIALHAGGKSVAFISDEGDVMLDWPGIEKLATDHLATQTAVAIARMLIAARNSNAPEAP